MALTEAKLVRLIAKDTKLSQKKSSEIVKVLISNLIETLAMGDSVSIRRFGKFYLKYRKERIITHPLTHKRILVGPKKTVKFKCFKSLHDEINYKDVEGYNTNRFKKENELILQQLYELIEGSGDYEWEEN
jgi:nucleoid DNA-binding protein